MIKKKVVIGMSGGIDSSVSAWLLKEQGYEVIGLFMKNWENDDEDSKYCQSRQDWIDAVSVADIIDIDIEAVNFSIEYKNSIFTEFLQEYQAGRTPNPDILCNVKIKFKVLLDYAIKLGADLIATGHYAGIRKNSIGKFELMKAVDLNKDQSYFLYRLSQTQLSKTLFPLSKIFKTEVRDIAKKIKLPNAMKKDSTGICFIGQRPFRQFLKRYLSYRPGPMKTSTEDIIGEHIGLSFYTLGQRKGIGLGGIKAYQNTSGNHAAWYVIKKDIINNTLYVAQNHDHPSLLALKLQANQASWIANQSPKISSLNTKIRYCQVDVHCILHCINYSCFTLYFYKPQWAVTPGQSVVLYQDNICLGGGIIDSCN